MSLIEFRVRQPHLSLSYEPSFSKEKCSSIPIYKEKTLRPLERNAPIFVDADA